MKKNGIWIILHFMATSCASFEAFLDGVFFPATGKPKKKKKGSPPDPSFSRSAFLLESARDFAGSPASVLWLDSEYPEALVIGGSAGGPADALLSPFASLFPSRPFISDAALDPRAISLLAFRCDSYERFSPPGGNSGLPSVLVKKTTLKTIEAALADDARGEPPGPASLSPSAEAPSSFWKIGHSAEFLASRFFLPPRASVSSLPFASIVHSLTTTPEWAQNTKRFSFAASWTFAGQNLSVRYHLDLSPTSNAQLEALAKAAVASFFREALLFWTFWKRPVEKPALSACPSAPTPGSIYLAGEIRGEGQRIKCTVEFPKIFLALILKMTRTEPLAADRPTLFDFVRAGESLFALMNPSYRKAFVSNPKTAVPFSGPTIHSMLSLMDESDRFIVVQNFLLPRYELQNVPLFFYYHVAQEKPGEETVYKLRPALPIVPGEMEQYLSESARRDWNYAMSRGCAHRISLAADCASLNAEAVLNLARETVSGKLLLSEKALRILKEELLAPLDAVLQKELDAINANGDSFAPLKGVKPKMLMNALTRIENQELAMACLDLEDVFALLAPGMSQGRRADVSAEMPVMKKRLERGELSLSQVISAKKKLLALIGDYIVAPGDAIV